MEDALVFAVFGVASLVWLLEDRLKYGRRYDKRAARATGEDKARQPSSGFPHTLVVRPTLRERLPDVAYGVVVTSCAAYVAWRGVGVIAWAATIVFGLMTASQAWELVRDDASLTLSQEGFTERRGKKSRSFRWESVRDVQVLTLNSRYGPLSSVQVEISQASVQDSVQLVGLRVTLWNTYGMRHEDLRDLLNDWRTAVLSRSERETQQ